MYQSSYKLKNGILVYKIKIDLDAYYIDYNQETLFRDLLFLFCTSDEKHKKIICNFLFAEFFIDIKCFRIIRIVRQRDVQFADIECIAIQCPLFKKSEEKKYKNKTFFKISKTYKFPSPPTCMIVFPFTTDR